MNKYQPVIGMEVHVETKTDSKMFCYCSSKYFGQKPNTNTCPVCLGLPGAVPIINQKAIENCIKIGLALNCQISPKSLFERKNYFYPDLPKGYQISQYRYPLCVNGWIEVENAKNETIKIRINRVHQEEDTAKLMHLNNNTAIDFNRSGVPLVEIVTEPDFEDVETVVNYAKKLQQIFRYLDVSDADMEKGQMRLEANVSVRKVTGDQQLQTSKELPNYRIELKNINSFRFMSAAIKFEIQRQSEALDKGEKLIQETRGWNQEKNETYLQREKEQAHDYRYFPDPDLPELNVQDQEEKIKTGMPELPDQKAKRFIDEYGLNKTQAQIIVDNYRTADYFEDAAAAGILIDIEPIAVANFLINQKTDISQVTPGDLTKTIKEKKSGIISGDEEIRLMAKQSIEENPQAVEDYKKGRLNALQVLLGSVMRLSKGKADVVATRKILEELLQS